jgi:hypothetical protein
VTHVWEIITNSSEAIREVRLFDNLLENSSHTITPFHQNAGIEKILEALDMLQYLDSFKAHHVDANSLLLLSYEDLREVNYLFR